MKINVFARTAMGPGKRRALESIARSGEQRGLSCSLVDMPGYAECDIAVFWGLPKEERTLGRSLNDVHQLRNEIFAKHGGPSVIVEAPLMGRMVRIRRERSWLMKRLIPRTSKWGRFFSPASAQMDEAYSEYRLGVGGALADDGGLALSPFCPDRWVKLRERLNMPDIRPYRKAGRHILVVGQVPGDASLRGQEIYEWILNTCECLRRTTDMPIVVRLHPLARLPQALEVQQMLLQLGVSLDDASRPISSALQNAWAMVTYSSGAAIDSLLAGVPAISTSPASFAWEVTDHDLACIIQPTEFEREPWLEKLAAAQWSGEELENGAIWDPVLKACAAAMKTGE